MLDFGIARKYKTSDGEIKLVYFTWNNNTLFTTLATQYNSKNKKEKQKNIYNEINYKMVMKGA